MDRDSALRTGVKISFAGVDITKDIKHYLLSVSYTDSEEDESDSLQIQLQDREGLWQENWLEDAVCAAAASKLSLSATITTQKGLSLETGALELEGVEAEGPPSVVSINGVSLGFSSDLRQTKKSRAWEQLPLSGIAGEIAQKAAVSLVFECSRDPFFTRVEQVNTSDIKFLSDLCHDAGISLKFSDGQLVLFEQAVYEAKAPVLTIRKGDGTYTRYRLSTQAAGTQYGSCRVSCVDMATGTVIEGIAKATGEDVKSGQRLEVHAAVKSAGEAEELAQQQLRLHNKFNHSASISLPGNPVLVAGVTVRLCGFGGWSGKYMVKQAEHTVDKSSGYTTAITLRKVISLSKKNEESAAEAAQEAKTEAETKNTHEVKKGQTLWALAKEFYGSGAMWEKLYEANRDVIGDNPSLIYPGQVLVVPE